MKIGFIGTGKMGGALACAASKNAENSLLLANRTFSKAEKLAVEIGGKAVSTDEVVSDADLIFLGVKPQMLAEMLEGIKKSLAARKSSFVLVSMVAGTSISKISDILGTEYPIIRIMPNIPVSVEEGAILYCQNSLVTQDQLQAFLSAMQFAGKFFATNENLIDAGCAVSGCGPAFAAMFAEALADGGVACGLPRNAAVEYAAQMMIGTAKMILENGIHPGQLKDAVCSPGGSTIQGVRELEEGGFRGLVTDAVIASYEKTINL